MSSKSNTVFITSSEGKPVFFLASKSKVFFNRESVRNVRFDYNFSAISNWILATDFWNDSGVWGDFNTWND